MANEKQNITLVLDWHRIPLCVDRADEQVYREAAKMLNTLYEKYEKRFPQKSPEELWMYVALSVARDLKQDTRDKNLQPVMEKVAEMNKELQQFLEQDEDQLNKEK